MSELVTNQMLEEVVAYYDARTRQYDDWWYRQGRYHRTPEDTAQ